MVKVMNKDFVESFINGDRDLRNADLKGADLEGADLKGVIGL